MKRVLRAAPVLCTLLLLALGACLPRLASLAYDRRLEREVLRMEDASVSLELSQDPDFFRTLELFQQQQAQISLTEGRRMTQEQAQAAAIEAMRGLAGSGRAYSTPEATPVLMTEGDGDMASLSAIFWRCTWSDETLWLDDSSGLPVAFSGRLSMPSAGGSYAVFAEPASALGEYCRLYYPADTVKLRLDRQEELDFTDYTLILSRTTGSLVETLELPVRIRGGWTYFNL